MSTDYGFKCRTHLPPLASPSRLREYEARHLYDNREGLACVRSVLDPLARVVIEYEISEAITWLLEHQRCDVVIVDEYGQEEPVLTPAVTPNPAARAEPTLDESNGKRRQ
jgi:hypothetical protein